MARAPSVSAPAPAKGRRLGRALLALLWLAGALAPAAAGEWDAVATPAPGPPRAIGGYSAGCLAGAVALPPEGEGYQAVNLERRRHFGHPQAVAFVQDLGRAVAARGLGRLAVGDMAQPRGGPMAYGHASHQTGLDIDIWYRLDLPALPRSARAGLAFPSVLDPATGTPDPALWTAAQAELVRLAAGHPQVARIFVHPALKRDLCARDWPERGWLERVRPWFGHDDHLHVRLACPADSPDCRPQEPPPRGEGCGAELLSWFEAPPAPRPPTPPAEPPPACRALLAPW